MTPGVQVASTPLIQITPSAAESLPLSPVRTGGVREAGLARRARAATRPKPEARTDRQPLSVRPACIADMRALEPLINGFAKQNLMLPKTHDQLARLFREFVVVEDAEGRLLGCGALRVYNETLAEIASLAVDQSVHGLGIGRMLVDSLMEEARALGLKTVFALTLQEIFFHRLGFRTVSKEMFPLKVWADCRNCPKLHACDEIAVAKEL